MSRITTVSNDNANTEQAELFEGIHASLGTVPNFLRVLANSPTALKAFLGLHAIANEGSLKPQTRERIALALAEKNSCKYCLSAHSAIAQGAGLSREEIDASRDGASADAREAAAIQFALALAEHKGDVSNSELLAVRNAGFNDADIVEIITHTGMNILTNILAKSSRVAIDFPTVELKQAS